MFENNKSKDSIDFPTIHRVLIVIYLLGIFFPDYCRNCNEYHSEKMEEHDIMVTTYSDGRVER